MFTNKFKELLSVARATNERLDLISNKLESITNDLSELREERAAMAADRAVCIAAATKALSEGLSDLKTKLGILAEEAFDMSRAELPEIEFAPEDPAKKRGRPRVKASIPEGVTTATERKKLAREMERMDPADRAGMQMQAYENRLARERKAKAACSNNNNPLYLWPHHFQSNTPHKHFATVANVAKHFKVNGVAAARVFKNAGIPMIRRANGNYISVKKADLRIYHFLFVRDGLLDS